MPAYNGRQRGLAVVHVTWRQGDPKRDSTRALAEDRVFPAILNGLLALNRYE